MQEFLHQLELLFHMILEMRYEYFKSVWLNDSMRDTKYYFIFRVFFSKHVRG